MKNGLSVQILGCRYDRNSSYLRGCAEAPLHIREALMSDATNLWTESGLRIDLEETIRFLPDMECNGLPDPATAITQRVLSIMAQDAVPFILGGDHSLTYPAVKAVAQRFPTMNILHLDAHPDLYRDFHGNPHSHASPFARIIEEGLCRRLVQVGIRTLNSHQRKQAEAYGVEMVEMKNMDSRLLLEFKDPLYISLDMDVLEPGMAPGISHYEPGGMTPREVIGIIQRLRTPRIIGADIVEYNPKRDLNGITASVAAKFLKEILGKIMKEAMSPMEGN